jgi:hypothetical protein
MEKSVKKVQDPSKMEWSKLLRQAVVAVALLIIAAVFILIFSPVTKPSEGLYHPSSPYNQSWDNQSIITPSPENATPCTEWILSGGDKDTYTYLISASYSDTGMELSAVLESYYLGYNGGYNMRGVRMNSSVSSQSGDYSSNTDMVMFMDSDFKCIKANVTTTIQNRTFSQEVPCSQAQGRAGFNFCADQFTKIRDETITVKAGTFQAGVYSDGNSTVWISNGTNVPIKVISSPNGEVMELVSYRQR